MSKIRFALPQNPLGERGRLRRSPVPCPCTSAGGAWVGITPRLSRPSVTSRPSQRSHVREETSFSTIRQRITTVVQSMILHKIWHEKLPWKYQQQALLQHCCKSDYVRPNRRKSLVRYVRNFWSLGNRRSTQSLRGASITERSEVTQIWWVLSLTNLQIASH